MSAAGVSEARVGGWAAKAESKEGAAAPDAAADTAAGAAAAAHEGPNLLQTGWCFWHDKKETHAERQKRKEAGIKIKYQDTLSKFGPFFSVEGFWNHYVHMKRPSDLVTDMNFSLFRDECMPMWEAYPLGGCWILKVKKGMGVLGKLWQDLLLGAIGELFEEPRVVGVTLAIRSREDMISVWNRDNSHAETRFRIGEKLKSILGLETSTMIEYKYFAKSVQDKSTYSNAESYVYAGPPAGGASSGGGSGSGGSSRRSGSGRSRRPAGASGSSGSRSSRSGGSGGSGSRSRRDGDKRRERTSKPKA